MPVALLKHEKIKVMPYVKATTSSKIDEVVAFCPGCKTLETLYLSGGQLMPTRKFYQNGENIYHDCYSNIPCCLYRMC